MKTNKFIKEQGGFDSFETQLHFETSIIKEVMLEKRTELMAKIEKEAEDADIVDLNHYKRDIQALSIELIGLLELPAAKITQSINNKYQPTSKCLAVINYN